MADEEQKNDEQIETDFAEQIDQAGKDIPAPEIAPPSENIPESAQPTTKEPTDDLLAQPKTSADEQWEKMSLKEKSIRWAQSGGKGPPPLQWPKSNDFDMSPPSTTDQEVGPFTKLDAEQRTTELPAQPPTLPTGQYEPTPEERQWIEGDVGRKDYIPSPQPVSKESPPSSAGIENQTEIATAIIDVLREILTTLTTISASLSNQDKLTSQVEEIAEEVKNIDTTSRYN